MSIKNKDLIKALQKLDPELEVVCHIGDDRRVGEFMPCGKPTLSNYLEQNTDGDPDPYIDQQVILL